MFKKQLDGLRGFLFLVAFTYHHHIDMWFLTYALPCFFVLSGFLITRILLQGEGRPRWPFLKNFFIRRSLRVFPPYFIVVAVTAMCGNIVYPLWHASYLFNFKLFDLSLEGNLGIFTGWEHGQIHLWSMCVEEQYYLLYPLVVLFVPKRLLLPAGLLALAGSIYLRFWFAGHEDPRIQHSLYGALLPVCGEYIIWGSIGAILQERGFNWGPKWLCLYGGIALLVGLSRMEAPVTLTGFFQFIPAHRQTAFGFALTVFIIGLWNDDEALVSRFLCIRPLTWLGRMSYGLYLVHMSMWDLDRWLIAQWPALAQVPIYVLRLSVCILIESAMWYAIEKPVNDLKRFFPVPGAIDRGDGAEAGPGGMPTPAAG